MRTRLSVISGRAPIIGGMAVVTVNSLHCAVTYKITAMGIHNNGTLVGSGSPYIDITTSDCPLKTSKVSCVCIRIKLCIHTCVCHTV